MKPHWKVVIVAISMLNICFYLSNKRLWRDTYINFREDELVLPSGDAVPVGRWFTWPDGIEPLEKQYPKYSGIYSEAVRGKKSKTLEILVDGEAYMGLWSEDDDGVVELFVAKPIDKLKKPNKIR